MITVVKLPVQHKYGKRIKSIRHLKNEKLRASDQMSRKSLTCREMVCRMKKHIRMIMLGRLGKVWTKLC